ncbi:MAG TPA: GIY-YIG nuclease family protein [Thermoanaerobaculia bacterium]
MREAYVYIMSNRAHRIYVGSTVDLPARVAEHKRKKYPHAFTAHYNFYRLVWFEVVTDLDHARRREMQIKRWTRVKKVALVQAKNRWWRDLSATWTDLLRAD